MLISSTEEEWEIRKKMEDTSLPEEERLKYEKQWFEILDRREEELKDCPFAH